jgi:heptaprenyl diphosphate synthase
MYRFISIAEKICTGEYNQLANSFNVDIRFKDYYKTISGKTAALFWLSAYLGAVLGGEKEKQIQQIARFGQMVGLIFQIMDDCKDYEMTEEEALKPVKSDLKEGVITLPLIFAMAKDKSLREDVKKVFAGGLNVVELVDKVHQNDGVAQARGLSKRYFAKASKVLRELDNEVKKAILLDTLHKIYPSLAEVSYGF